MVFFSFYILYIPVLFSGRLLSHVYCTFVYLQLCDVWFEEIKPHLLRNNIKVHIHNSDGAGAGVAGAGAGDHNRDHLPSSTPAGCSHLVPGAASDVRASLKKSSKKSSSVANKNPSKKSTKKSGVDLNKKKFYK